MELIPYAGLMDGMFRLPLDDPMVCLGNLREDTGRYAACDGVLFRYRLFSLYTWDAEISKHIGEDYVATRSKMNAIDKELFSHYMERKRSGTGARH